MVPVWYKITAAKKIAIEGPYHALCNAGAISYVECSGDISKNIDAFEKLVKEFCKNECTYFSINTQPDRCPNCNSTSFVNGITCPVCGYNPNDVPEQKYHVSLEDVIDVNR